MGKNKKFINKKNSATFQLLARDSSDPNYSTSDRVFVRVDNNSYSSNGFLLDGDDNCDDVSNTGHRHNDDPDSVFADAPEDEEVDENPIHRNHLLPDHIRREVLELGLPDDGYNYLLHLREIKNSGGGSSFYHNSKAKLDQLPLDVKAYDASRLPIYSALDSDSNTNSIYSVASKTVGVKIQKAVDPDVAAMLDNSDLSQFGSDVEDLEEDFIVRANLLEEEKDKTVDEKSTKEGRSKVIGGEENESTDCSSQVQDFDLIDGANLRSHQQGGNEWVNEKPRVRRPLDEQFDLLTLREYDSDTDSDDAGSIASEGEPLAAKINPTVKDYLMDEIKLNDKYKVPGDFLHGDQGSSDGKQADFSADIIRKCAEYAEMYSRENKENEELVVVEESSDESEGWDCETIVSTYSNLDNHPGKILAPEKRGKKLTTTVSGALSNSSHVISLRGKEKLPLEFLPHSRRNLVEKEKKLTSLGADQQKRRPHGEESKEEKKERKAAVKEEKREARKAKKELKGLYRGEAQHAQKVAAISGPCSIHLM
ncbi:low temperature viability protein [Tasmannia lanceolata]|uniref:low temperature viability protein n=1 Tax=Tasmannia lanceolata TaxID=3420 RepID=UPI0040641E15